MDCLPRNAGFLLQFQVSLQRFDIFFKSPFPLLCHPAGGTGLLPYKLLVYLNVSGTAQFLQLYTDITRSNYFTSTDHLTLDGIKMIKEPSYHTNTILYREQ